MFQTTDESTIMSACQLDYCHKSSIFGFLLYLTEEGSFWFLQNTSQDAALRRLLRSVLGAHRPFSAPPPTTLFEPLYIYGPNFVRHRLGHVTLIATEVGAGSVVELYKKVEVLFFLLSFSWLTYVSWWRHARSYGFPQEDFDWSVRRPMWSNCWTSSGLMNCYATTLLPN